MCGIVAAAARRNIVPDLVEGLRRLEYRGYDSCGVAVLCQGGLRLQRTVSRVSDLAARMSGTSAATGLDVVPLQLPAYHAAVVRGTDVDKPRNLAKSVTVE